MTYSWLQTRTLQVAVATVLGIWLFMPASMFCNDVGTTIRFSFWAGAGDHQLWRRIIDGFQKTSPDVRVVDEWLPLSGYAAKLDQQFVAGCAPDVMLFQDEPFPRYAEKQFADLTLLSAEDRDVQSLIDDCWPGSAACFQWKDVRRGLPIMGGAVQIFCNLDAFDHAKAAGRSVVFPSPEWTLEEFTELCRQLTVDFDHDGTTDQYGFFQPGWVYFIPFIWAHEMSRPISHLTDWSLFSPSARDAFVYYSRLRNEWHATPTPAEYAGQNSDTAFISGRVAMCVNGPWFESFLRETDMVVRRRVMPIPVGPGGNSSRATWDGICIYEHASPERKAAAWRFARYCLGCEAQELIAMHGRAVPSRRAVSDDYIRLGGGPDSPAAVFVDAIRHARTLPSTDSWDAVNRAMTKHMTSMLMDEASRATPEQAFENLKKEPVIQSLAMPR